MTILNECEYAEKCLSENSVGENLFKTLSILSRYLFHKKGCGVEEIETELMSFSEKNYKNYAKKREYINRFISKISKNAKNSILQEIDGIWITRKELDTIGAIGDNSMERLLFTMLCFAKLNLEKNPNSNGWINAPIRDVFSAARVSGNNEDKARMTKELRNLGYIEKSKKNTKINYRVLIVDKDNPGELFVSDFRELGYEYLKYQGHNFIRCAECGILTRGNKAGTKRYCPSCIAYKPVQFKTIVCSDCGESFTAKALATKTKRCLYCQMKHRRELDRLRKCTGKDLEEN